MVADDDIRVREALVDLLRDDPRVDLIGAVGSAPAAIEMARELQPDIAILDVVMPGGGVEAALGVRDSCARTQVIGLSSFGDGVRAAAMLEAGAARYLRKADLSVDLLTTIFEVAAQGGWAADGPILD